MATAQHCDKLHADLWSHRRVISAVEQQEPWVIVNGVADRPSEAQC